MTAVAFDNLTEQISMLSYTDRLRLLERIAQTLQIQDAHTAADVSPAFERAFGMWQSSDVSLESIRQKAWGRS